MSDNGSNGILGKIYELQISQGERLGVIEGHVCGLDASLNRIETQCRLCTQQMQEAGKQTALNCDAIARHERRISVIAKRVDVAEDTGVIHLSETRAASKTLRVTAAIMLGLITALGGVFGLHASCQQFKTIGARK